MALSFPFPHVDTKLHVPTTRPGLVARPRLSRQLDRCVQHKLLLICAPAGFGKTTLLSQWSRQSARPVAGSRWTPTTTRCISGRMWWLRSTSSRGASVKTSCPSSTPLVVDDYYCIESDAIHEALAYLLDYAPANMHVVLATRTEPPLPLAQWRAGGQLVELRASDLRFSVEETERLFDQVAGSILSIAGIWGTAASDCTPADWALQWLWSQPEVSVVLSGMSTMQQVEENVASARISGVGALTAEEAALFDRVRARYQDLSLIPCTNCGYCMPCPNGVDIPGNLTYNEGLIYDKPDASRGQYGWWHYAFTEQGILDHDPRAALCVQCGECEEKCPQRIPISEWMPVIHGVLGEGKAYVRSLPKGP